MEGKCFVTSKEEATEQDRPDHFYVNQQALSLDARSVDDLDDLDYEISCCDICMNLICEYYDNVEAYKKENGPLRTMELFAGK
jgi:DNA (cytosine-5)-methyltransferase 1